MLIHRNKSLSIAVCSAGPGQYDKAENLAEKLTIPLVQHDTGQYDFLLIYTAEGLVLKQAGKDAPGPIKVNFASRTMKYRIRHGGGRGQALARALGLRKNWRPAVFDATAGLGRDGFIMAHLGCHVTMVERSPVLAALLEDGLARAEWSEEIADVIKNRLQFIQKDSKHVLQKLQKHDYPDVIYLDPMYPERTKSSLVKKEMRILRSLAGDDEDAADLLAIGLGCVRNRVVVKRPRLAPTLDSVMPSHQIIGKTSRFDVYMI